LRKSGEKTRREEEGAELSEVELARIHQLKAKKTGWPSEGRLVEVCSYWGPRDPSDCIKLRSLGWDKDR
jgi:hypothetical protein